MIGWRPEAGRAAAEPPPETTTIRFQQLRSGCWVPQLVAEDLLREEGFTDVQYVKSESEALSQEHLHEGKLDMSMGFSGQLVRATVPGSQMVFVSGLHAGCYSLIGSERINSVRDLKGKKVWAWSDMIAGPVIFFKALIAYVGLDPENDVEYVKVSKDEAIEMFKRGEIDAFMSFPPGPQQLRAQGIGKELVNTNVDRPWSQYFCCLVVAHRDFIKKNPVATKRAIRALMKANNIIAEQPEVPARLLVEKGIKPAKIEKLLTQVFSEIPYGKWRHYNPEDTIRFYALRLRELGMTKYTPQEIIARNTDWSFLKSLKDELNMTWV
jgi:NitT/TauT family transport system substrate-binding protein